jgi:hypothetical protein
LPSGGESYKGIEHEKERWCRGIILSFENSKNKQLLKRSVMKMNSLKEYETPEMRIISFQTEDILTTSLTGSDTGSGGEIDFGN